MQRIAHRSSSRPSVGVDHRAKCSCSIRRKPCELGGPAVVVDPRDRPAHDCNADDRHSQARPNFGDRKLPAARGLVVAVHEIDKLVPLAQRDRDQGEAAHGRTRCEIIPDFPQLARFRCGGIRQSRRLPKMSLAAMTVWRQFRCVILGVYRGREAGPTWDVPPHCLCGSGADCHQRNPPPGNYHRGATQCEQPLLC